MPVGTDPLVVGFRLRALDAAPGLAVLAAAAALYLRTAARDIVVGDTPELATAALTLGVPHPPGYPLLMLLGHVLGLLPVGPEAFRVNLLSALSHAATVGLVYLTARKLTGSRAASAAAALLLALHPLFWGWSLVLETFPLNDLLVAALVYLLVLWDEEPQRWRLLAAAAFVSGLGMANHHTIALLGPAVLYLLWRRRELLLRRPAVVGGCCLALAAGLLPYAYIPWAAGRESFWNWLGVGNAGEFVALVTRATYGPGQLVVPWLAGGSPGDRLGALLASFSPVQAVLLVAGAVGAYLWGRWYFSFVAVAFACTGPVFAIYANVDLSRPFMPWVFERFLLLPHVLLAPLAAVGVVLVGSLLGEGLSSWRAARAARIRPPGGRLRAASREGAWGPGPVAGVAAAAALVSIGAGAASFAAIDQSSNHVARIFAEDVLATVEPGGVLLASGDEAAGPLGYLYAVQGQRMDVKLIVEPLLTEDWYVEQVRRRYPDLQVPFSRLREDAGRERDLVAANPEMRFWSVGSLLDSESLRGDYWLRPRGLARTIEPLTAEASVEAVLAENEALFAGYRVPSIQEVHGRTFERSVVEFYARGAARVGEWLEARGVRNEARGWYERGLRIDPDLERARAGLRRASSG